MFTFNDLFASSSVPSHDPNFRTLIFLTDDDCEIVFRNVPAPANWDGISDWTHDEEYVMGALHGMTFLIENSKGIVEDIYKGSDDLTE